MKLLCVCVVSSTIIVEKERYGINENVTKRVRFSLHVIVMTGLNRSKYSYILT